MSTPESRRSIVRIIALVQVFFLFSVLVVKAQPEREPTVDAPDYQVAVGLKADCILGRTYDLAINLLSLNAEDGLSGFDFTFEFNEQALSFQRAYAGDVLADCGWEYFTYISGPNTARWFTHPGLVRVVGVADVFASITVPGCDDPGAGYVQADQLPRSLAHLSFKVTEKCKFGCYFQPVRFYWTSCESNVLTNHDGSALFISGAVHDFIGYTFDDQHELVPAYQEITRNEAELPTILGAPDECADEGGLYGLTAIRNVTYYNGGLDLICPADLCDTRGDVNLDGVPYEAGDLVTFTNYFVQGLAALPQNHLEWSIANSDVNQDGLTLTLSDLQHLVQVVIGNRDPHDRIMKESPNHAVPATITCTDGVFATDVALGAAHLVVSGEVRPQLLADIEMMIGFDGLNTQVLLFDPGGSSSFKGEFICFDGDIVSSEFVTLDGRPVAAKLLPEKISLKQNYPNPFNPTSTIEFEIPGGGHWELEILNIVGQRVDRFSGIAESGREAVVWDATKLSTGVYFYRLTAGGSSLTRKAVILK